MGVVIVSPLKGLCQENWPLSYVGLVRATYCTLGSGQYTLLSGRPVQTGQVLFEFKFTTGIDLCCINLTYSFRLWYKFVHPNVSLPKSDCVNLVAQATPIECLLYLPNVREIRYKLGPERLTLHGNSNVYYRCPWLIILLHIRTAWN